MNNKHVSKNKLISTHVDDGQLIKNFISANINMNESDLATTQLKDGFNKSRKLQQIQAKELHNNAILTIMEILFKM